MATGKYVGNCTKCNLLLADFDQKNGENPVCPQCSNTEKPGPMIHTDYVAKEAAKGFKK